MSSFWRTAVLVLAAWGLFLAYARQFGVPEQLIGRYHRTASVQFQWRAYESVNRTQEALWAKGAPQADHDENEAFRREVLDNIQRMTSEMFWRDFWRYSQSGAIALVILGGITSVFGRTRREGSDPLKLR